MEELLEINLRESVRNEVLYKNLRDFVYAAMLAESEVTRKTAAKTLVGIFSVNDMWIERGDCVDNQILLRGEYNCRPVVIYVSDKPKEYQGRPTTARNFDVKKL